MMRSKILTVFVVCLFAFWGLTSLANARNGNAPQNGGMSIYDGVPTEAECRVCHDDLTNFPMLLVTNVEKHHPLPSDPTTCVTCHSIWDEDLEKYVFFYTTDCLKCHAVSTIEGSPGSFNIHHETTTFAERDCDACHLR
ncbi:MAG: hypothetical protein KKD01_10800 [Proteobacteria bacterium]|nr:hypothetical protein [Pseudomonadota bacterium]MBU1232820.1 hypothetical protein [Pseudomonadota bacterium]MBU1418582.1 hypothetical protein [Pseudomonadota bacterium]MBU1455204.1 hypothetical protein [Pseudomonadota bacterium]